MAANVPHNSLTLAEALQADSRMSCQLLEIARRNVVEEGHLLKCAECGLTDNLCLTGCLWVGLIGGEMTTAKTYPA